jgi:glycerol-3-phosphate dehydrogenase
MSRRIRVKRSVCLDRIRSASERFDLVVVGGGATGLGVAVDAAARGHRVALLEQHDFAKATSSRSTKLVHGGVRYLRQGNIGLVLEALRERGRLASNAPHLVHDLAFVIPSYRWWEKTYYGAGIKLYDRLAGQFGLKASRRLSRAATLELVPTVEPANLTGGVLYHDGQFDDARLAVNLAQTACGLGAAVVNYCRCVGLVKERSQVAGVVARDVESGSEFTVRGRAVVNATGVWVDDLRRHEDAAAQSLVTVSQGVHLVLPKSFLPGSAALMIPKTEDGRVLFAVPWYECVILGTTDTPLSLRSLEPRALDEECDFLLNHARRHLAQAPAAGDILSVFAGLRPLVRRGGGNATAGLARDHLIRVGPGGLITVTGGKWTTYRKMAEDVVNQTEQAAGIRRTAPRTEKLPIHGWTEAPAAEKNLKAYGADAPAIRRLMKDNPALAEKLHPALPYQRAEVIWHARREMARTVEDVLARRTRALLLNAAASIQAAPAVSRLLAGVLGKDRAWEAAQVADFAELARGYLFNDLASRHPPQFRESLP